jgi:hypothetical protein
MSPTSALISLLGHPAAVCLDDLRVSDNPCDIVVSSALLVFALGLDQGGAECGLRAVSIANCAHPYQQAMSG